MKKADMKAYKEKLLVMRARLHGDMTGLADAALRQNRSQAAGDLSAMPVHMADIGSDNYEQEFTLNLMQSEEATIMQVERALELIEEGVYGTCEVCGGRIPKLRLNVIPYASMCVKCAAEYENSH